MRLCGRMLLFDIFSFFLVWMICLQHMYGCVYPSTDEYVLSILFCIDDGARISTIGKKEMSNRSVFLVNISWNDILSVFDAHVYTQTKVERGN